MGSLLSYLWGSSEDPKLDEVDPATGLTGREKQAIQKTWDLVMQDPRRHGTELFVLLFETVPGSQDYFKPFRGKDLKKVAKSVALRAHGTTVIHSLDGMIKALDDPECLVELVKKVGRSHHLRGITRNLFDLVADVIMDYLKSQLGPLMDDFTTSSWQKALKVINDVAEQAMTDENGDD